APSQAVGTVRGPMTFIVLLSVALVLICLSSRGSWETVYNGFGLPSDFDVTDSLDLMMASSARTLPGVFKGPGSAEPVTNGDVKNSARGWRRSTFERRGERRENILGI
ncbi:hypothetical protein BDR03DRAFT_953363, partial [Suillus americanus]